LLAAPSFAKAVRECVVVPDGVLTVDTVFVRVNVSSTVNVFERSSDPVEVGLGVGGGVTVGVVEPERVKSEDWEIVLLSTSVIVA
jgi:hypothetical protein